VATPVFASVSGSGGPAVLSVTSVILRSVSPEASAIACAFARAFETAARSAAW
jgi:hypothetical protein